METGRLNPTEKAALAALLDDPSPTVRQALLQQFEKLGGEGSNFLRELAHGPNRIEAAAAVSYLRELKFADPVAEFRSFIRSLNYELETGMLLLSRALHPEVDTVGIGAQLDALAARFRKLAAGKVSLRAQCLTLNRVLFEELGLRGNRQDYTDPKNSLLEHVLSRKVGLPITLSIVYLLVAQRVGLELEPVGTPSHFFVGGYEPEGPFFIDSFNGGVFLSPSEVFAQIRAQHHTPQLADLAPTPVREVLCRVCRNLASHYLFNGDTDRAKLVTSFVAEFDATYERHARS